MKERSSFPYDVQAIETDLVARTWTLEEEGLFHRLLRMQWANGYIPDNIEELAQICRISPEVMRSHYARMRLSFKPAEGDASRLQSSKLERERAFVEKAREKRHNSGVNAAETRWADHNKKKAKAQKKRSKNNADAMRTHDSDGNANACLLLSSQPNTIHTSPNGDVCEEKPAPVVHALGEFGHAKLTEPELHKLKARLNGNLDRYIENFDRWVDEDTRRRGQRKAYNTILAWFDRDLTEGKVRANGNGRNESAAQRRVREENEQLQAYLSDGNAPARRNNEAPSGPTHNDRNGEKL